MCATPLFSDVIVTKDGMVLNGKVVEIKKNIIIFSNFYGTYNIKKSIIKTLKETKKYEDDIKVLKSLGKRVNEKEIKKNFSSGKKAKEKVLKKNTKKVENKKISFKMNIHGAFFYNFNLGLIDNTMTDSLGALFQTDVLFISFITKKDFFLIPEFRLESVYYNSIHGNKSIEGFSITAGPIWFYNGKIKTFKFNLHIASLYGFGYYFVRNNNIELIKISFNTSLTLGFSFIINKFFITPALRYEYINDTAAPLHGLGFSISLGYAVF